ncbi:hypothetical protein CLCAR_2463 [Clostridium carboxidivorans P7]|nr:hypothetical protein CLCAR_2463 [Clostridium carboxidivorans P7]
MVLKILFTDIYINSNKHAKNFLTVFGMLQEYLVSFLILIFN